MLSLQMPQLQIEDVASVLQLAKTADIKAADGFAVGSVFERVEVALAFAKLQRAAQPPSDAPAPGAAEPPAIATPSTPSKIDKAVQKVTATPLT